MKKILSVSITSLIAVIAIAFTVVSLSGCGKKADPCITPTGGQSVNVGDIVKAKQEVSLWIDGEGYGSALKEALKLNILTMY